ncbi:hypothetical protein SUGI_0705150 [Cryptomeria japonica]|nr:hypothetical protein SUGI_0705150 [Cryptomeria japonica]
MCPTPTGDQFTVKINGDSEGSQFSRDEGKLVETIVDLVKEHVRKELKKSVKDLVGLDVAVEDFHYFLSEPTDEAVKIVGIVGPEGSGKTTLAEEFYYRYRKDFDRSSLLFGVREASKRNGLEALQRQLLNDLTNTIWEINNKSEGREILAERLQCLSRQRSLKFLIVIDDVDHHDQLDALLLRENVLGNGSLVILASRDKAILKLSGISLHYEMKPLAKEHARELLCMHAFNQEKPIWELESVVETAVRKFGGLPLFLKLIGRHLRLYGGNNIESWNCEWRMFCELNDIMKATFNALSEEEQQIFLDIACFFRGMDKESAIRIWDGSGWRGARGLQKLEYGCLVEIDENNCLKMHDSFRDFGRQIAKEQLCNSPEHPCVCGFQMMLQISFKEYGHCRYENAKIRGSTDGTKASHGQKRSYTFSSVKIELLDIDGDISDATVTDRSLKPMWFCWKTCPALSLSDQLADLVWFRWRNFPHATLPPLEMNNLRDLELVNGNFKILCDPAFKQTSQLRELNIIKCRQLVAFSPSIGSLKHLEKMVLKAALHLQDLPEEFCNLNGLRHLVLRQCEDLTKLPNDIGRLKNLEHVDLSDCQILSALQNSDISI